LARRGQDTPYPQVMELSEHLKLRLDFPTGETQQDRLSRRADPGLPNSDEEEETRVRKALASLGESHRQRPESDRVEPQMRVNDRFNGGLHRRRFVQDGDIPVTVLRRDQGHDGPAHRGVAASAAPTSSRLQRVEAELVTEKANREKAERLVSETQALVKDLQTKIGHAELAKNEANAALQREREAMADLRAAAEPWKERLQQAEEQARAAERSAVDWQEQLAEERQARQAAENALQAADAAREEAEELIRALSEEARAARRVAEPARKGRVVEEPEVVAAPARRVRRTEQVAAEPEPEPVKWWLNTKPAGKRR
jgi:hypothetical protein